MTTITKTTTDLEQSWRRIVEKSNCNLMLGFVIAKPSHQKRAITSLVETALKGMRSLV